MIKTLLLYRAFEHYGAPLLSSALDVVKIRFQAKILLELGILVNPARFSEL